MSIILLLSLGLSVITIFGDFLLKNASLKSGSGGWLLLIIGCVLYGLTGLGWFFLMREAKLSTLGVIYSVAMIIGLTVLSVFIFREKITPMEIVGVVLAIVAVMILYRFAYYKI